MLAYSSIAQAGYILIAVAVAHEVEGALSATGYYLAAYLFMNLGAFAVVAQLERAGGTDEIAAVRGLGWRAPVPAAVLALSLLSLASIPPLAGFAGKVLLLQATLAGGRTWLAIIAAINMAVALYYYVAVIAEMYLHDPEYDEPFPGGIAYVVPLGLSVTGTIALGILPGVTLQLTDLLSSLVSL